MSGLKRDRVVIVGAGHAGGRAALHLRSIGYEGEIHLIGEEPELPYERPPLSKEFLTTDGRDKHAALGSADDWERAGVTLHLHKRAIALNLEMSRIELQDRSSMLYDHLIIATGATPRQLTIPGSEDPAVRPLRSVSDAEIVRRQLNGAKRILIIGGGVIGLEVAAVARQRGVEVHVVEAGPRLMSRIVPASISSWFSRLHESHGAHIHCAAEVKRFARDPEGQLQATLRGANTPEQILSIDLALVAIGVIPCIEWLRGSGLELGSGVVVNAFCRCPPLSNCYAIGDVAETWHSGYGRSVRQETWRNAENQAKAVAEFIHGRTEPYVEMPWMWSDQYATNLQMLGLADEADTFITRGDPDSGAFSLLGVRDSKVVSAALINRARDRRVFEPMIANRQIVDLAALADPFLHIKRASA